MGKPVLRNNIFESPSFQQGEYVKFVFTIDIKKVMVITVVILNTSIALALLYVALQLWQLRLRLVRITNWIIFVDSQAHTLLGQTLEKINISQENISHLGHRKQRIDSQMQNLQQVMVLIVWGKQLWGRYLYGLYSQTK